MKGILLKKNGFTLVELLVVIAIIGILSTMGYAGLQGAVENNRVKDAALNITAFLERVSNEANRMSKTLCLKKESDTRLGIYEGNCSALGGSSSPLFDFNLEPPMKFVAECPSFECDEDDGACNGANWIGSAGADFKPKFGLSAAPSSGYVCAQYGSTSHFAAALKRKSENTIHATMGYGTGDGRDSDVGMDDL